MNAFIRYKNDTNSPVMVAYDVYYDDKVRLYRAKAWVCQDHPLTNGAWHPDSILITPFFDDEFDTLPIQPEP